LIRDADGRELAGAHPSVPERFADHGLGVAPNLGRVVLDETRLRIDLRMLALRDGNDTTLVIEDHETAARGALIERRRRLTTVSFASAAHDRPAAALPR
jgi:hypothetical protein